MPIRTAKAEWSGNLAKGHGEMEFAGWKGGYSAGSRFESAKGTNPEELIAAAHAGCFSMALSHALSQAGHEPKSVRTSAAVHINKTDAGFAIQTIELTTLAKVPGISKSDFERIAGEAKTGCPVSRALSAVEIKLNATLE